MQKQKKSIFTIRLQLAIVNKFILKMQQIKKALVQNETLM